MGQQACVEECAVFMKGSESTAGRVLITGAGGFIGSRLWRVFSQRRGLVCRGMLHTEDNGGRPMRRFSETVVADLLDEAALTRACDGVDAIIHCAGPAPFFDEDDGVTVHRRMDEHLEGTRKLLNAAVACGVERFIHLSSVRAAGRPGLLVADESWVAAPDSLFGQGKLSIEHQVLTTARSTGMAAVNLRLAPVYGHGCGGDIGWLIDAVRAGWMPPLPETHGRHSIVHVSDVIDAVYTVLTDARAYGKTYIVTHGVAHSGAEIFDAVRATLGRKPARWRVSERWLHRAGRWGDGLQRLLRQPMPLNSELVNRLLEVECYSAARIRAELGWEARVGLTTGLRDCIRTRAGAKARENKGAGVQ